MDSRKRQTSLLHIWSSNKRNSIDLDVGPPLLEEEGQLQHDCDSEEEPDDNPQQTATSLQSTTEDVSSSSSPQDANCMTECEEVCCSGSQAFQPRDADTLSSFVRKDRKFLTAWYDIYAWVTLCVSKRKVFCFYCRHAAKHNQCSMSTKGEDAFSLNGFDNYKKALEKFQTHEKSALHREAVMKWHSRQSTSSIQTLLSTRIAKDQLARRSGLIKQLEAMKFLLRQGIPLRGHTDDEGNLNQLLVSWSNGNKTIQDWLKERQYQSHDIINELIILMGQNVLRKLLEQMKLSSPNWYSIIVDEASDVSGKEQCNLSLRYVNDAYEVSEDSIGLYSLPDTTAATLATVVKDILVRCGLPLSLCRGQAYDGAANMQGKRKGLATIIKNEAPAALSVHCLAHSLNLCLQDAGRQNVLLRNSMDIVREIVKLVNYSPKRKHLFSQKLQQTEGPKVGIKPLCATRWTVRTEALDAVIKQYSVIMDTMEEVNHTTRDEYGLKAGGVLAALEKFEMLFGLKLGHLLFSASEDTSRVLQSENLSLQEAITAVKVTQSFFKRQRNDDSFNRFYDNVVKLARDLKIGSPILPRYRQPSRRLDSGSQPHQFQTPKEYFRQQYFVGCDLLICELTDRFNQEEFMTPVQALEILLLKSANGETIDKELQTVRDSVYKDDFDFDKLGRQLCVLVDVVHEALPNVKEVTNIRTICDAMCHGAHRTIFSEVHKLIRLYLTIPITTSTSERAFSSLRRLLTYMRSTMTEKRLNNCMLLHVHKELTDKIDLTEIAKEFVCVREERQRYFGTFVP